MQRRALRVVGLFPVLWGLACGSGASEPTSVPAVAPPPRVATTAPVPLASSQTTTAPSGAAPSANGWIWKGTDPGFATSFYHGPIGVETSVGMCRFVLDKDRRMTTVECFPKNDPKRLWGRDEGGAFVDNAVLVADADHLYVARYPNISSGCEVIAYDLKSGNEIWRTPLVGLGPVAHSEYLNSVEMRFGATGKLDVFGWESAGKYIEELDLGNGATLSTVRLDSEGHVTAVPVPPPSPRIEPPHPGEALKQTFDFGAKRPSMLAFKASSANLPSGGSCAYSFDEKLERASFSCIDASSKRTWGFDLANQFVPAASVASDKQSVFVASYCAISSGATVSAYESATGRLRWRTDLYAIGPIDHSKYSNVVSLRVVHDRVVLSGWEASGKYVEVLDPSTGRDLGSRVEP